LPRSTRLPVGRSRQSEFDVHLHVAELFFRGKIAGAGHDLHVAVLHFPGGRAGADGDAGRHGLRGGQPVREVFAVEEDNGVGRRIAGLAPGVYDRRMRTRRVVNVPLLAGNESGVSVVAWATPHCARGGAVCPKAVAASAAGAARQ
jgi:hypothetical protein